MTTRLLTSEKLTSTTTEVGVFGDQSMDVRGLSRIEAPGRPLVVIHR